MVTFIVALVLLVVGFCTYGLLVEKVFGIEPNRKTPALTKTDGVDFVPMAPWRIFLVQYAVHPQRRSVITGYHRRRVGPEG